jgi:hypothetical protein
MQWQAKPGVSRRALALRIAEGHASREPPLAFRRQQSFNLPGQSAVPKPSSETEEHLQYHRDGSLWVKGQTLDGLATGYWEWFRRNSIRMRSGFFERGKQIGEWTTYDRAGAVYKVTTMKSKANAQ